MNSTTRKRKAQSQTQTPTINSYQQHHQKCEETSNHHKPITTVLPYLPTPILFDIFSRLRIKTLFNCRLVCKNWAALISAPEFAQLHLSKSPTSCLLKPRNKKRQSRRLHLIDLECPYSRSNKFVFTPKISLPNVPLGLLNSCNGLVCLCQFISLDTNDACNIFVCNPVLREYITLPKPPLVTKFHSHCCAFGFSHKTNQYKVLLSYYISGDSRTEIYTVGKGTWRRIENAPYSISNHYYNPFVDGALHWLDHDRSCPLICCFDFVIEQFRAVPEPSEFGPLEKEFCHEMRVGVINGNLSICDYSNRDHVAIWVMKDYGVKESWSKDIVINHLIHEKKYDTYESIMIRGNGEILVIFNNNSIMLYDPKSDVFKSELKIYGVSSKFHAIAHVPSLISLKDVAKGENLKVLGRN